MGKQDSHQEIREFYDSVYYKDARTWGPVSGHLRRLVKRVGLQSDQCVLDVACGTGEWLAAVQKKGAAVAGVDISEKAVRICQSRLPNGAFHTGVAEELPFTDGEFDLVSCLGSLEHFVDMGKALQEMIRVAKDDARFLLLVPNADFLTKRLRLFSGTEQTAVKEESIALNEWERLFAQTGLTVKERWRDLHILSWSWIAANHWYQIPFRLGQAIALVFWPLSWQYQVYYLCEKSHHLQPE